MNAKIVVSGIAGFVIGAGATGFYLYKKYEKQLRDLQDTNSILANYIEDLEKAAEEHDNTDELTEDEEEAIAAKVELKNIVRQYTDIAQQYGSYDEDGELISVEDLDDDELEYDGPAFFPVDVDTYPHQINKDDFDRTVGVEQRYGFYYANAFVRDEDDEELPYEITDVILEAFKANTNHVELYFDSGEVDPPTYWCIERMDALYKELVSGPLYLDEVPIEEYCISMLAPRDYGKIKTYGTKTLIYYRDNIVTDMHGIIMENHCDYLGKNIGHHILLDVLYIRNDEEKMDYKVVYDSMRYIDSYDHDSWPEHDGFKCSPTRPIPCQLFYEMKGTEIKHFFMFRDGYICEDLGNGQISGCIDHEEALTIFGEMFEMYTLGNPVLYGENRQYGFRYILRYRNEEYMGV